MAETVTVRGEGITAELILWRKYGVAGRSLVAQMMTLNPGLAALGPRLPLGTQVVVPDLPETTTTAAKTVVTLFG